MVCVVVSQGEEYTEKRKLGEEAMEEEKEEEREGDV